MFTEICYVYVIVCLSKRFGHTPWALTCTTLTDPFRGFPQSFKANVITAGPTLKQATIASYNNTPPPIYSSFSTPFDAT